MVKLDLERGGMVVLKERDVVKLVEVWIELVGKGGSELMKSLCLGRGLFLGRWPS